MRDDDHPIILLSGGLDSALCLSLGRNARALFVDYGQPAAAHEARAALALAQRYSRHLTIARVEFPAWQPNPDDPTMLVPGRNLVLISLAAALGAPVVLGVNADDHANYPDCRPAFFGQVRRLVKVETPLIGMTKPEIGAMARERGMWVDETWTCYYPGSDGKPCGRCDACAGRARALA